MARQTKDTDDGPLDIFEALKRALLRSGFIPKNHPSKGKDDPVWSKKSLAVITANSHDILFAADTVFPFTLFPDTVILDREKLTIINRYFFGVSRINVTPVRDILSVEANLGPFFGSIHLSSRYFVTNPYSVHFLLRSNTIKLRRLLQGYIIAHEQKIDCTDIDKKRLITLLNELGSGA